MNDRIPIELREDGRIQVSAGFRDKENVKQVPGHRWVQAERVWTVPGSWAAAKQLRGVFGDRLEVGERLAQHMWEDYEKRVKPCLELRDAADAPWVEPQCHGTVSRLNRETGQMERVPATLTPLQRAAVAFMAAAGQAIEGDPMGSGKTPTTICALKQMHAEGKQVFPALVVCGAGAKPHWATEFADDWWQGVEVSVVEGNVNQRRKALEKEAHVYVINWESMIKHTRLAGYGSIKLTDKEKEPKELNARNFQTVIVDEIHRAKNPKAKQTRGIWAICDKTAEVDGNIFGLTGSLIGNTPVDLWAPMRATAKEEYPARSAFIERYALLSWNHWGAMDVVGLRGETREELFSFLDPRFIRRPKKVILPEVAGKIPPRTRDVVLLPKQRKAYNALKEEMLVELDGGVLMASNPMVRMGRLRQLAGATGEIDEEGNLTLKKPSSKIDELLNIVEEAGDESIAVYAESRQLLELAADALAAAGVSVVQFTGKIDKAVREQNRVDFQEGRAQVILLTYGAGAESINLSRADLLVRLEFSWSAIKNSQAEERPVRSGREGDLRIIDIVAADTVDEVVRKTYGDKLDMLEQVVRDEETLRRWLS